jgi:hypothetical protein
LKLKIIELEMLVEKYQKQMFNFGNLQSDFIKKLKDQKVELDDKKAEYEKLLEENNCLRTQIENLYFENQFFNVEEITSDLRKLCTGSSNQENKSLTSDLNSENKVSTPDSKKNKRTSCQKNEKMTSKLNNKKMNLDDLKSKNKQFNCSIRQGNEKSNLDPSQGNESSISERIQENEMMSANLTNTKMNKNESEQEVSRKNITESQDLVEKYETKVLELVNSQQEKIENLKIEVQKNQEIKKQFIESQNLVETKQKKIFYLENLQVGFLKKLKEQKQKLENFELNSKVLLDKNIKKCLKTQKWILKDAVNENFKEEMEIADNTIKILQEQLKLTQEKLSKYKGKSNL